MALFVIIIIGIRMAAWFINIVIMAVILAMLGYPVVNYLKRKRVPDVIAITLVTIIGCLIILALVALIFVSLDILIQDIPLYQVELDQRLAGVTSFMQGLGITTQMFSLSSLNLNTIVNLFLPSLMKISDLLMYFFFIGVTTFFLLMELPHLEARVRRYLNTNMEKYSEVSRLSRFMVDFMVVRTETNLIHGILFGGGLWIMGVHAAVLWGVLTVLLTYIPYLGLIIAAIPAIFFAWLQFGVWGAVAVIVLVCILNLIVENPVVSYLAAKKFKIPPLLVIVSTLFWTWVLGFVGLVFGIPITLIILIIIQCSDEFRWVNVILGVDSLFLQGEPKKAD
ncbi:MAG: AI-2E family transporter [Methanoregula sp.]|nr:AI-2E family transporter [Methanoregula sp.]